MTVERMLKLSILQNIVFTNIGETLEQYNLKKIKEDYESLLDEFLTEYALDKQEKS